MRPSIPPPLRLLSLPSRHVLLAAHPRRLPHHPLSPRTPKRISTTAHLPPPPPPPPPPKPRSKLRVLIWSTIFLTLSYLTNRTIHHRLIGDPIPPPNTAAETAELARRAAALTALPIVQVLLHHPAWTEYKVEHDQQPKQKHLTQETLSGAFGIRATRNFQHEELLHSVVVLDVGGGLNGWPGVVHGGALASVLVDWLRDGRALFVCEEARRAGAAVVPDTATEPEAIEISYLRKTPPNDFYVLWVWPAEREEGDDPEKHVWWAELCEKDGQTVLVRARAVFGKPVLLFDGEGGGMGEEEREWCRRMAEVWDERAGGPRLGDEDVIQLEE